MAQATERQISYIRDLMVKAQVPVDEGFLSHLTKQTASSTISALHTKLNEMRQQQPEQGELEPGVYENEDGVFVVKWNREHTRQYAKRLVEIGGSRLNAEGDHVEIEFDYAAGAIYRIKPEHRMPLDKAKMLTLLYGKCINCGRRLKAAKSVEQGIGPVCIKAFAA